MEDEIEKSWYWKGAYDQNTLQACWRSSKLMKTKARRQHKEETLG